MSNTYTEISLTYKLRGECLVQPSNDKQEAMYSIATKRITLGSSFIENALLKPRKPRNNATNKEWDNFRNWNKLSIEHKLANAVKQYVKDLDGLSPEFELM